MKTETHAPHTYSDDELKAGIEQRFASRASGHLLDTVQLVEELYRRGQEKSTTAQLEANQRMVVATRWIAVATIVNALILLYQVLRAWTP